MSNAPVYGVGAEFKSAADLYHAAEKIRDKGFKWWDTYSPYPIHGMEHAMGTGKSWVSFFVLGGGLTGGTIGILLQTLTSIPRPEFLKDIQSGWLADLFYPLIVHGKPFWSLPAFFPVLFELTILLSAFGAIGGLLISAMLPRLHHPIFNWELFSKKGSDDGFFLVIEAADPLYSEDETKKLLEDLGGTQITVISK